MKPAYHCHEKSFNSSHALSALCAFLQRDELRCLCRQILLLISNLAPHIVYEFLGRRLVGGIDISDLPKLKVL